MDMTILMPVIKGICVVILLPILGVHGWGWEWWVAMIALNIMVNG